MARARPQSITRLVLCTRTTYTTLRPCDPVIRNVPFTSPRNVFRDRSDRSRRDDPASSGGPTSRRGGDTCALTAIRLRCGSFACQSVILTQKHAQHHRSPPTRRDTPLVSRGGPWLCMCSCALVRTAFVHLYHSDGGSDIQRSVYVPCSLS